MVLSAVNGYGCFWLSSAGGLLLRELYVDAELPVTSSSFENKVRGFTFFEF